MATSQVNESKICLSISSVGLMLLLAPGCFGAEPSASEDVGEDGSDTAPDPERDSERITGIGVDGGPDAMTYDGIGLEEVEGWGPVAYVVDHHGLNWLADGPGHKILVIDDEGAIVDRYDLEGLVRGIEDIEVTETHVYVLMLGGATPIIARAGRNDVAATAWETFDIPTDELDPRDITGLRKGDEASVGIELTFGREHLPLFGADGTPIGDPGTPRSNYEVDGHEISLIAPTSGQADNPSRGTVLVDGVEVAALEVAGMLGDFGLIGATPEGDLWVRAADVGMLDGAFFTRMFAYRFGLDGTLMQVVEMPMRDELMWAEHRIAMDPDGELRVMSMSDEEVSLRRPVTLALDQPRSLPPPVGTYLPTSEPRSGRAEQREALAPDGEGLANGGGCISRDEIMQRAYAYANFVGVYNAQHMKTCANRTPLAYFQSHLGVPIHGVAYKYAGHIEVSTYANAVANNYTIGDLNTKVDKMVDKCSFGVDCSGFVSKAWLAGHHTTSSMHMVSSNIGSYDALRPGDALNKPGSHIRLVAEHLGAYGVQVVESTTSKEYMRVVAHPVSWGKTGFGAGYAPIRYTNVCPDAPPPPPPPANAHIIVDVSGYMPAESGYVPVGPSRLLDTRVAGQEFVGPLASNDIISVTIAGKGGLPAAAQLGAVVLNVTVANPEGQGYLAAYPDAPYPGTSNINFSAEPAVAGLVVVDPGADGKVDMLHFTNNGTSHVVVDAFGYFPPEANVHMVTPARVFDSREAEFGAAKIPAGTRDLQLAGDAGVPLAGVSAVIANLTVVAPVDAGFATIYEAGTPLPTTSNLNHGIGEVRSNLVIVPLSASGHATLYTLQEAHYVVDVLGWFGEGVDFEPISPIRVRDTRIDNIGPISLGSSIAARVVDPSTVPDDALAIFGNLTVVHPSYSGFLKVYPDVEPSTSNLNFSIDATVANAIFATIADDGNIRVQLGS